MINSVKKTTLKIKHDGVFNLMRRERADFFEKIMVPLHYKL
jgi:hypothetical protein